MKDENLTKKELVEPLLRECGWTDEKIWKEKIISIGKVLNEKGDRSAQRRADYVLYYPDKYSGFPIAVLEVEREEKSAYDGLQQAKEYREKLDVPFAFSTNGHEIIFYNHFTFKTYHIEKFPSPEELWEEYLHHTVFSSLPKHENPLFYPICREGSYADKEPRYYQEVAIKRIIERILSFLTCPNCKTVNEAWRRICKCGRRLEDKRRLLLTMATGSGKTYVAFQVVWKLYNTKKIRRVLFIVDRIFLRKQAFNAFSPFGNAKIELKEGEIDKTKDVYFATYQTLYSEKNGKKIYEHFDPDFFDLIIIDECHRSGWKRWHDILRYFSSAIQLGMTATPKRSDNIDVYAYFGKPVYEYKLSHGIEDGYLANFEIYRVFTNIDKEGRLILNEIISKGAKVEIPEGVKLKQYYTIKDFEREITLPDRTRVIVDYIIKFLEKYGEFDKTVIFCASQYHAAQITELLNNYFNPKHKTDRYAVRITVEEPYVTQHLDEFRDAERRFPVVATTVDLLSTGVDIPCVKNIIFLKPIESKVEFHQIVGRGSRIDEGAGKYIFRIIDFVGATELFDEWDLPKLTEEEKPLEDWYLLVKVVDAETGEPIKNASIVVLRKPEPIHIKTDEKGIAFASNVRRGFVEVDVRAGGYKGRKVKVPTYPHWNENPYPIALEKETGKAKKEIIKVENLNVYISEENRITIDLKERKLLDAEYIEYAKGEISRRVKLNDLRKIWLDLGKRREFLEDLRRRGIDLTLLSRLASKFKNINPNVDEFDLLASLVFNVPRRLLTRDERVLMFLELYSYEIEKLGEKAKEIAFELLDRYKMFGVREITDMSVFDTPPFDRLGRIKGIIRELGGGDERKGLEILKSIIDTLQKGLYHDLWREETWIEEA
jgi:type I restriction enzyme R subunit